MRWLLTLGLLLTATTSNGADKAAKVTATLEGRKVQLPAKSVAEGTKALIGLLDSCTSRDDGYTAADLKKARQGDHVRVVFPRPVKLSVEKVEVSEVVFTQPSSTGVLWIRSGKKVLRWTKFDPKKEKAFKAWLDKALASTGSPCAAAK
jgi:hypothetical protein